LRSAQRTSSYHRHKLHSCPVGLRHPYVFAACARSDPQAAAHGAGFPAIGGLFAKEAIQLLQDFYIAGNPAGKGNWSIWQQQQKQEVAT
jgi:hypothetical protein